MTSMKYPNLYQMWRNHDLRYKLTYFERHPLWQNLRIEDEECVWLFIEAHYFDKYSKFIQVFPEWSSSGLWNILSFLFGIPAKAPVIEFKRALSIPGFSVRFLENQTAPQKILKPGCWITPHHPELSQTIFSGNSF